MLSAFAAVCAPIEPLCNGLAQLLGSASRAPFPPFPAVTFSHLALPPILSRSNDDFTSSNYCTVASTAVLRCASLYHSAGLHFYSSEMSGTSPLSGLCLAIRQLHAHQEQGEGYGLQPWSHRLQLEGVKTYEAPGADIWMVHRRKEVAPGLLKGVSPGDVHQQEKHAPLKERILRSRDLCVDLCHVGWLGGVGGHAGSLPHQAH
jgi:hypothetical protein